MQNSGGSSIYSKRSGEHRIFGFNNPYPSPGSPNYGWESWITIGSDVKLEEGIDIKNFGGGLYAVTRCDVKNNPYDIIPATWKQLVAWCEGSSKYGIHTANQELEEHIAPFPLEVSDNFTLDLYLPLKE